MVKKLLFFDSQDGTKNYDINASDVNYFHPYNLYFPLPNPLSNINRIILKSVEMPICLFNIRNSGTMNLFSMNYIISGFNNSFSYRIAPGLYPTISNLITYGLNVALIQNNITVGGHPISATFTSISGNNGFTLMQLTHNASSFTINNSFLFNNILGFASGTYNYSPIIGIYPLNLFPDTHLYMFISNIQSNNNNLKPATFKIPLPINYSTPPTNLYYEDSKEHQIITLNNNSFILDKLNIIIYDKFGYPVEGYLDWSFSIFIEYDEHVEHHKETIQFLNFNN